jgi:hypothetical protein
MSSHGSLCRSSQLLQGGDHRRHVDLEHMIQVTDVCKLEPRGGDDHAVLQSERGLGLTLRPLGLAAYGNGRRLSTPQDNS